MALIRRTLLLKKVVQKDGQRFPAVPRLDLHVQMDAVFSKATTVWDRHFPSREKVKPNQACLFFERVNRDGDAVLFHAYAYRSGVTPDQAVLDDIKAKISAEPLVDESGTPKEVVERFAIIVLGEALVIENAQVPQSGPRAIQAIRDLIRRHVAPKFPNMDLEDAPSIGFKQMAKLHGGVKAVTARLQTGFATEPNTFGRALETFIEPQHLGPHKRITTTIEALDNSELNTGMVEELVNESEKATGLSGITVLFNSGVSMGDLETYRERMSVEVQAIRAGVPAVTEIETEMVDYLLRLTYPTEDNFQLIDQSGKFVPT